MLHHYLREVALVMVSSLEELQLPINTSKKLKQKFTKLKENTFTQE